MMRILIIWQMILIIEHWKSCERNRYSDDEDSNNLAIDTDNWKLKIMCKRQVLWWCMILIFLMVMVVIVRVSHTNSFAGKSDQMNSDVSIKCETTSQMHCATLSEWHHQFITLHLHLKVHSTVDLWNKKRWKFKSSIKRGGETANFLQGVRIVTTLGIFERGGG